MFTNLSVSATALSNTAQLLSERTMLPRFIFSFKIAALSALSPLSVWV